MKNIMKVVGAIILIIGFLSTIVYFGFRQRIVAWVLDLPEPEYAVTSDINVMVSMRDGIRLASDIYRPNSEGRFPVVLTRVPYGKQVDYMMSEKLGSVFAGQGFVFITQDVRGKFHSEGKYYPYVNEAEDGIDTIDWIAKQSWSNGSIGMWGLSYFGSTQWLAGSKAHPALKTINPIVTSQDPYRRWMNNGVLRYNDILVWHIESADRIHRKRKNIDWEKVIFHLPLIDADNAIYKDVSAFNDWILNPVPGEYWDRNRVDDKVGEIDIPALIIEGWYDYYLDDAIEDYHRMIAEGQGEKSKMSQLIIGPWNHTLRHKYDVVDFGNEANKLKLYSFTIRWFSQWLKNEDSGVTSEGPVTIFVMGKNKWRSVKQWPPEKVRYVDYYLHSNGNANTESGDGRLDLHKRKYENPDTYNYDPVNPVMTDGGTTIYGDDKSGPADQKKTASREDVLVYSTLPLKKGIEVTGPVELVLYASSSAIDTDFTARLVDVDPNGKAINLKDGIVRARFRESLSEPSFLIPDKVYEFRIKIGAISNYFKRGHRIRLQVSSSNFPEYSRNLNTGASIGLTREIATARQKIYHNDIWPSRLILPVMPQD